MLILGWGTHAKRFTVLLLTLSLLFGGGITTLNAYADNGDTADGQGVKFSDIEGHWAREQILGWGGKGLVAGYSDGTFGPERGVTRAEFITFMNRAYGLTEKAQVTFSDVSPNDWFCDEVAKAVAAGYISGYNDGTMRPASGISRLEAAIILYKLLRLASLEDESWVAGFNDSGSIATWGREYVNSAVAGGYLSGYPDGAFRAQRTITRAETVALLSKAVGTLYNTPGVYGPEEGNETVEGNVTVNTSDVMLQNLVIEGDLFLTAGIGDGDFEADGVVVKGRTIVSGGGEESVIFNNTSLEEVIVYIVDGKVRVVARGDTDIEKILMESGGHLQEDDLTGEGFGDVQILVLKPGETIELEGDFEKVSVETTVDVSVTGDTRIGELIMSEEAEGTTIDTGDDTVIENLTLNGDTEVTGQGTIKTAYVNTDDYDFETDPDRIVPDGETSSSGGGGSSRPTVSVSAVIVTDATTVVVTSSTTGLTKDNFVFDPSVSVESVEYSNGQYTLTLTGSGLTINTVYKLTVSKSGYNSTSKENIGYSDVTLEAENFNTHKSTDYVGINVGWNIGSSNVNLIDSMVVELYAGDTLLATNTGVMEKLKTVTGGIFSTPFIILEGTYTEESDEYWEFGDWSPVVETVPTKAVITITDVFGKEYSVENTSLAAEPNKAWADLFSAPELIVTVLSSTRSNHVDEDNNTINNFGWFAVKLSSLLDLSAGSKGNFAISYEFSTDDGNTWEQAKKEDGTVFFKDKTWSGYLNREDGTKVGNIVPAGVIIDSNETKVGERAANAYNAITVENASVMVSTVLDITDNYGNKLDPIKLEPVTFTNGIPNNLGIDIYDKER